MIVDPRTPDALPALAARLRRFLTALVLFLAIVIIAERAAYAGLFGAPPTVFSGRAEATGLQALLSAPNILYLAALWQLRQAAAAAALGTPFGLAAVKSIRGVGYCLIAGAALALFAVPLVFSLLEEPRIRLIDHDVATLIIAGIGLGLVFIGQLMGRASEVEAELEQIF